MLGLVKVDYIPTTLTGQMAGVQGELQKLNIQTAKLDTILEMLEKHGN